MKNYGLKILFITAACFFVLQAEQVSAYRTENAENQTGARNFEINASSFGVELEPGQSAKRTIEVSNWLDEKEGSEFQVEVEDFTGAKDPKETVDLKGDGDGKFSAKDWLKPETEKFILKSGEKAFLEVEIAVPRDADAGDHYAAVLISNVPQKADVGKKTNVSIRSRIGVLFFVRVKGDIKERGRLVSFEKNQSWYEKTPVGFKAVFENRGTVRLQPHGRIEIRNIFGRSVGSVDVEPYNVLRDSSREMEHIWNQKGMLFGRYAATLKLSRGYGSAVDEQVVSFWIIPWKIISVAALLLFGIYAFVRYIHRRFYFEVKIDKAD